MAAAAAIPVAMTVASMVMSAAGARQAAAAAQANAQRRAQEANFEADQLRVNAGQEVAAGQAAAAEQRRQAVLTQSRAIAVAAAGGGSVSDPTVVNLLARNAGEGVYRAGLALYQGNERARQFRMQAAGKDIEAASDIAGGEAAARAYQIHGVAGVLSAASTLFSKYGSGAPGGGTTAGTGDAALLDSGSAAMPTMT